MDLDYNLLIYSRLLHKANIKLIYFKGVLQHKTQACFNRLLFLPTYCFFEHQNKGILENKTDKRGQKTISIFGNKGCSYRFE